MACMAGFPFPFAKLDTWLWKLMNMSWGFPLPEGLPFPSNRESHESHENSAGDDGKGVLEGTGGIEAGEDENKTPDDVSAEQHKGERRRPPPHGQDEQPGCEIKKADHSG
jgi:hypothetical protein